MSAKKGECPIASRQGYGRKVMWGAVTAGSLYFLADATALAQTVSTKQDRVLEEVTVTSQRREQDLIDVPISISVLGGDQMDTSTFTGVTEALRTLPGVMTTVTIQGGGTQLAIRGVAAANPVFNGPSPTAYYLDSVSLNMAKTAVVPDAGLYDLERIEVLRGPQGTLYGSGGMGGVVRVLTHGADLNEFSLKGRTSVSSTEDSDSLGYRGDFAVNVPLIPGALAARATVSYQNTAGWIDRPNTKDANDAEAVNARLKVRAQPTEDLYFDLTAWRSRDDGNASYSGDNRTINRPRREPISTDFDIYGATIGYDFSSFSVKNTASYIDYHNDSIIDTSPAPISIVGHDQLTGFDAYVFSNEVSLSSALDGNWQWTFGGVYRDSKDKTLVNIYNVTTAATLVRTLGTEVSVSGAVFGELTRTFMDGLWEVTAGLRYFTDKQTSSSLTGRDYARREFHATTPRFVVTVHPNDQLTGYVSYSEGFRSGYTQGAGVATQNFPPVEPDSLRNYEIGMKGTWLDGLLDLETAVYYLDWQDTQQSLVVRSPVTGQLGPAGVNAESASGTGFEMSLTAHVTSGLTLGASYGWNDLSFDSDVFSGTLLLYPKGESLNFSTKKTASVSASYDFPFGGSGFEGRVSSSANYTSALPVRRVSSNQVFLSTGDSLTFVRAGFDLKSPDERWTASLFVDNLTNEDGAFLRNFLAVQDFDIYPRPRTIGLQVEYSFAR